MYCSTASPDWARFHGKYTGDFMRQAESRDSGETLYVDTRWVVLYASEDQKVPVENIRDCLVMLNKVYSGQNTEELQRLPNTQRTPWKSRVGVPNIQFLPLDASQLQVEYQAIDGPLDSKSPVSDGAARGGRVDGVLNIYISSSGKGSILGQAELGSNIVYALNSTIGGYSVHGKMPGYHMGKTVAHEVGHALGLVHTFADDVCDGRMPYPDVPEQIRPNFSTSLVETAPGEWEQRDDNRFKDRLNHTVLSCLHVQADKNAATDEMGVNIMDYGDDPVSIMLTPSQVTMMREWLTSAENTSLKLKAATDESYSATIRGGDAKGDGSAATAETVVVEDSDDGSTSTAATVAFWVIFGVIMFLLLVVLLWWWWRSARVVKPGTVYVGRTSKGEPIVREVDVW